MHKVQRGYKLSVGREVVTTLNFVSTPSFSVTTPSCKPDLFPVTPSVTTLSFRRPHW